MSEEYAAEAIKSSISTPGEGSEEYAAEAMKSSISTPGESSRHGGAEGLLHQGVSSELLW